MKKILLLIIIFTFLSLNFINAQGITEEPNSNSEEENTSQTQTRIDPIADDGIRLNSKCLTNGQCGMNIYKILDIRKSDNYQPTVKGTIQDLVLSATMFFGTILTILVLVAGFMFILAGAKSDPALQGKAKKTLIGGVIGFLLVVCSYAIIRLVQFLATAGGG